MGKDYRRYLGLLQDETLNAHLREISQAVLDQPTRDARQLMGNPDWLKLAASHCCVHTASVWRKRTLKSRVSFPVGREIWQKGLQSV